MKKTHVVKTTSDMGQEINDLDRTLARAEYERDVAAVERVCDQHGADEALRIVSDWLFNNGKKLTAFMVADCMGQV
jgi:uncharacterized heparinase superfamily protein